MKKRAFVLIMCLSILLLCGCSQGQKKEWENREEKPIIGADASGLEGEKDTYALYFRLGDTGFLAQEDRQLIVERDETVEMALVRSLIAGPSATAADLVPLFPQGTEVLATAKQGSTLYVTLNERFLSGYAAERSDGRPEEKKAAVQNERQLCLDALAATLTEAGLCSRVQVLIYRNQMQGNSMRLEEDFLLQNGSTLPLEPAVRREETLYTPHNAAMRILTLWMNRNLPGLTDCLTASGRPGEQALAEQMDASPVLTGFSLGHGQVSADGKAAVICADLTLHQNGSDWTQTGWPLTLTRERGVWKISWDALSGMMTED